MLPKSVYLWILMFALILPMFHPYGAYSREFYKWIDENGVVHVTDDIGNVPEKYKAYVEKEKTRNNSEITDTIKRYLKKPLDDIRETIIYSLLISFLIILYFTGRMLKKAVYKVFTNIKVKNNERLVNSSGISELNLLSLRKIIREILVEDGYRLSEDTGIYSFCDFVVTRGKEKLAVVVNENLNPVSRILLNDIVIESRRLGCTGSIFFTTNTFEPDVRKYAKDLNCITVDKYSLARMIKRHSYLQA